MVIVMVNGNGVHLLLFGRGALIRFSLVFSLFSRLTWDWYRSAAVGAQDEIPCSNNDVVDTY